MPALPLLKGTSIPARHSGAGRNPVASVGGFRENLPLLLLDSGLRRNDSEGNKPRGKMERFGRVGASEEL
jgi:hypothetical protein